MKIDFCPNKRRLILLSCPLQLISIDSRSPNGQQPLPNFKMVIKMCFNSRSPSGLRPSRVAPVKGSMMFQFTQLKRAATGRNHAADQTRLRFNSRSPSGLRLSSARTSKPNALFQFTQPKRAATQLIRQSHAICDVSIHAAQAGCDEKYDVKQLCEILFQFTQPKRAATVAAKIQQKRDSLKG